jgi:hypothetical protein
MSQRECAGFNWPPLSIPAMEPINISPEAVSRAGASGTQACTCMFRSDRQTPIDWLPRSMLPRFRSKNRSGVPFACWTTGVAHPASSTVLRLLSLLPAALLPFCAGVPAIGVGHPASFACDPSIGCIFAPQLPAASSFADGVSQPAKDASAGSAPPAWFGPPFEPSVARGVFHEARTACWDSGTPVS